MRKATGYVSSFAVKTRNVPIRICQTSLPLKAIRNTFPKQMNGMGIVQLVNLISVYSRCGSYQTKGYDYILDGRAGDFIRCGRGMPSFENRNIWVYHPANVP